MIQIDSVPCSADGSAIIFFVAFMVVRWLDKG